MRRLTAAAAVLALALAAPAAAQERIEEEEEIGPGRATAQQAPAEEGRDAGPLGSGAVGSLTPRLVQGWDALNGIEASNPYSAADLTLAVGREEVLEAANLAYRVYARDGTPRTEPIGFAKLLEGVAGLDLYTRPRCVDAVVTDPKAVYHGGRFYMTMIYRQEPRPGAADCPGVQRQGFILLSVSRGEKVSEGWCNYRLPGSPTIDGKYTWADFPNIGVTRRHVMIGSVQIEFGGHFVAPLLTVLSRSDIDGRPCVTSGKAAIPVNQFHSFYESRDDGASPAAFGIYPVSDFDDSPEAPAYVVSNQAIGPDQSTDNLYVWRIPDPSAGNPAMQRWRFRGIGYAHPKQPFQPSGSLLGAPENRMQNAVRRNGRIWLAHAAGINSADDCDRQEIARWAVLSAPVSGDPAMIDDRLYRPACSSLAYPTIMPDAFNNFVVAGTFVSRVWNPSSGFGAATAGGAPGALTLARTGVDSWPFVRWGDYSGSAPDPVDPHSVWFATQYVSGCAPACVWGSFIQRYSSEDFSEPLPGPPREYRGDVPAPPPGEPDPEPPPSYDPGPGTPAAPTCGGGALLPLPLAAALVLWRRSRRRRR